MKYFAIATTGLGLALSHLSAQTNGINPDPNGPDYRRLGPTTTVTTGTYQAILRGENFFGVAIFGASSASGTAAVTGGRGLSSLYYQGDTASGTCFGIASENSTEIGGVIDASRTRQGSITVDAEFVPDEVTTFDINDVVKASANFTASRTRGSGTSSTNNLRFQGDGVGEFSAVFGLDVSPVDPTLVEEQFSFEVFVERSSLSQPTFTTIPVVQSPSIVVTSVTTDTTTN